MDTPSEVMSPKSFYSSANGAILVYDSTNLETLNNLQKWISEEIGTNTTCALWGCKGNSYHFVEPHSIEGFREKNCQRISLFAEVDIDNDDDGHIMKRFIELLECIHKESDNGTASLTQTQSTVRVGEEKNYADDNQEGKICSC